MSVLRRWLPANQFKCKCSIFINTTAVGDHSAVELDVSSSKSVAELLTKLQRQYKAPPTIIINSAGITRDNWMLKLSEDDFDNVQDVNLKVFMILVYGNYHL